MTPSPLPGAEIAAQAVALVQTFHDTEQALEALTGGQVDAIAGVDGRLFLLREAQARLRSSEAVQHKAAETLLAVLNALPAHVALLNPDGVILTVNESWRRFADENSLPSPSAAVGDNYLAVCDRAAGDDTAAAVAAGLRGVLSGAAPSFTLEYPCHSPAERRWFQVTATPLSVRQREGAVVMHVNITDRKQAEADLHQSAERLRMAVAAADIGLWDWNLTTNEVVYSTEWKRQLGYEDPEIRNQLNEFETRVHPDDLPDVMARVQRYLARPDGVHEVEFRMRHKDGSWRWIFARGEVELSADGAPVRMRGCHLDFTERKTMERNFLRAQRMESLGTLAGGIAHDLNNILSPILMSVEVLRDAVTAPADLELLTTLEGLCHRGSDLVKQVLGFARGVDGKRAPVKPAQIITELAHILHDTFPKNIELMVAPVRDAWTLTGDATQLHQVLLNLCVNARDAMPQGGRLSLTIENVTVDETFAAVHAGATAGAFVRITVSDTGTGIPAAVRDRIFEPFFTTKEVGKGTGLGLSTTLSIVQSHGGFVTVDSDLGAGTTFRVYLPATVDPEGASPDPAALRPAAGHGELILVVDDEPAVRDAVRRTLERNGYQVCVAANGAEAVAAYAAQRDEIALVLTDMSMPIMDGPALIQALRAISPAVLVVGSSGRPGARDTVVPFVSKPYTAAELLTAISNVLARSGRPLR